MREFSDWLLNKPLGAALVVVLCALLPVVGLTALSSLLCTLIIGFVTLSKGSKSGLVLLAWAAVPSFALLLLHKINLLDVVLLECVVIWVAATALVNYHSWRLTLEIMTLLGVLAVICVHLVVPDIAQQWFLLVEKSLMSAEHLINKGVPAQQAGLYAKGVSLVVTGLITLFLLLVSFIELLLANYWQKLVSQSREHHADFLEIRASQTLFFAGAVILALAFLKSAMAVDILPVMLFPFFWAGLSLLHRVVKTLQYKMIILAAVYLSFLWLGGLLLMVISLFGLVDVWVDFRKRFVIPKSL